MQPEDVDRGEVLSKLGRAYEFSGHPAEALQAYRAYADVAPEETGCAEIISA